MDAIASDRCQWTHQSYQNNVRASQRSMLGQDRWDALVPALKLAWS